MPETTNRELTLLVTAGILLGFAAVDYWTPYILENSGPNAWSVVGLALGACIAQVTLIAAWAVFAPGNIVVRLPWALLLGLAMWYVLAWSELHSQRRGWTSYRAVAQLGLNLLAGVTVLQVPLWVAKRWFGYRMFSPGEAVAPPGSQSLQFQLKHLLIGTTLFAVALSPLRFFLPKEPIGGVLLDWRMVVVVVAAICVNLVATLPCLWGGFVTSGRVMAFGVRWLLYCLLVTGIEFACLCAVDRSPPASEIVKMFLFVYLINASQGIVVFVVMRIYWALGYRLERAVTTVRSAEREMEGEEPRPEEPAGETD